MLRLRRLPLEKGDPNGPSDNESLLSMKQPYRIRVLNWFAALASLGMFVSIALPVLDIGPHLMGGEKVIGSE